MFQNAHLFLQTPADLQTCCNLSTTGRNISRSERDHLDLKLYPLQTQTDVMSIELQIKLPATPVYLQKKTFLNLIKRM